MSGVDLFDQKTTMYRLDRKSSGGRYYLRLFFDLMDMCMVNSHIVYKECYPTGRELLDFKILVAKSLIGSYNSRQRIAPLPVYSKDLSYQPMCHFTCQLFNPHEENQVLLC